MLEADEQIEELIEHKNYLPFRLEDWLRIPIYLFVIGLGIFILINEGVSIGFIFIIPIMIVSLYLSVYKLLKRWVETKQVEYIITDRRLIIHNKKKNKVEHSFKFSDFPCMTLRENAYNYGYIILGEPAPLIVTNTYLLRISRGINIRDHDLVIENLPNVRKVYNRLRGKTGRSAKSYT